MAKVRLVRRSQTLSPFGVGAILDIEGESFVAVDAMRWGQHGERLSEPRLQRVLNVRELRAAPPAPEPAWSASPSTPGVPYRRFPRWLFCGSCRRMTHLTGTLHAEETPRCGRCYTRPRLTPMRFVMACARGHLADVPWEQWAHSRHTGNCQRHDLRFQIRSGGSGLEFLRVRCSTCQAERHLGGLASPNSLEKLRIPCTGRQPWEAPEDAKSCDAVPQVLQRGATNLTFSITNSSLDIPPYSTYAYYSEDSARIASHPHFATLLDLEPGTPAEGPIIGLIANQLQIEPEAVRRLLTQQRQGRAQGPAPDPEGDFEPPVLTADSELMPQEYEVLTGPDLDHDPKDRFIKRRVELQPAGSGSAQSEAVQWLVQRLGGVMEVPRLREVRALVGFSRLSTPFAGDGLEQPGKFRLYDSRRQIAPVLVKADLGRMPRIQRWLPALEVFGEGVFLSLDENEVARWENLDVVTQRVRVLTARWDQTPTVLPRPTPRLLLVHTLSHCLIRALSF